MPKFSRVFIRDYNVRAPGVLSNKDLLNKAQSLLTEVKKGTLFDIHNGSVEIPKDSSFYPRRADLKIMRAESILAVVSCGELLSRNNQNQSEDNFSNDDMGLYTSTSLNHGRTDVQINSILDGLKETHDSDISERNQLLHRKLHPLFGLTALTNAAESFVAQHCKIHGDNATYGDTALSGFEALLAASWNIEEERSDESLCLGTNCGGFYSTLAFESYHSGTKSLHESTASAAILLSNDPSNSKWKVSRVSREKPSEKFDYIYSSSAFDKETTQRQAEEFSGMSENPIDFSHPIWGSLGAA